MQFIPQTVHDSTQRALSLWGRPEALNKTHEHDGQWVNLELLTLGDSHCVIATLVLTCRSISAGRRCSINGLVKPHPQSDSWHFHNTLYRVFITLRAGSGPGLELAQSMIHRNIFVYYVLLLLFIMLFTY